MMDRWGMSSSVFIVHLANGVPSSVCPRWSQSARKVNLSASSIVLVSGWKAMGNMEPLLDLSGILASDCTSSDSGGTGTRGEKWKEWKPIKMGFLLFTVSSLLLLLLLLNRKGM